MKGQESIRGLTAPSGIRTQHSFDRDFLERQRHVNSLRSADHLHDVVERKSEHEHARDDHHLRRIVAGGVRVEEQRPEVELGRDEPEEAARPS